MDSLAAGIQVGLSAEAEMPSPIRPVSDALGNSESEVLYQSKVHQNNSHTISILTISICTYNTYTLLPKNTCPAKKCLALQCHVQSAKYYAVGCHCKHCTKCSVQCTMLNQTHMYWSLHDVLCCSVALQCGVLSHTCMLVVSAPAAARQATYI